MKRWNACEARHIAQHMGGPLCWCRRERGLCVVGKVQVGGLVVLGQGTHWRAAFESAGIILTADQFYELTAEL